MTGPVATLARKLNTMVLNKYMADIIKFLLRIKMNLAIIERKNVQNLTVKHMNADAFGGTMPIQDTKRKRMQIRVKLENAKKRRCPDYDFDELKRCKQQKKNSDEAK
jgi:hypothetical protein